jgi:hypothetical protein
VSLYLLKKPPESKKKRILASFFAFAFLGVLFEMPDN